jgi:excisionase family DNA binding protein
MNAQLLKPEEVRELLNVSRSWLYEAANDGRIPSVRLGPEGPLRFDREEIERWLERGLLERLLEVPVVTLGDRYRAVPELPLNEHERLLGEQPRRGSSVAHRVQRHVAQAGILQRCFVPVARNSVSVQCFSGAASLPTSLIRLALPHRHDEYQRTRQVIGPELGFTRLQIAQQAE